ncbi:hypothetical protein FVF58_09645 [Paraburkholderia panacisoli]|uniref:Uncharacterized protein n=1 Tax=Paraburkholderia panacisoli TaxID=2603818 RepID=A0A5B0HDI9_9BURK|nr:hypothetical protein [Paraburkholderia panacisoli]KAA1013044.1 hypothetical protein FVF58_09645 [Paraburkholderia panacisoli]
MNKFLIKLAAFEAAFLLVIAPLVASAQSYPAPTFGSLVLQNPLTPANGGTGATTSTGTGSVVLSNSPTFTTPNLGTPSAVTLTHGTGLPISTGVSGLGSGVATGLANGVTGSGSPVLATSPTLTSPALGTPSAVTLTNGIGLPIATGVSGLGTGVATGLSNAATGSGGPALSGSPTFTGTVTNNSAGNSLTIGGSTPVNGSPGTFFYPTYFGNAGTGVAAKFNRMQVGTEALSSLDLITGNNQTTSSWVSSWLPAAMPFASIAVTSQIGVNAIVAASRTSDYRTWTGGASGGAGSYFFALNDDTGTGNPIACGLCGVVMRASGVTGISLNQLDVSNFGSVVDATPNGGVVGGTTFGLGITAGAYYNTLNNATAAIYIGDGQNAKFRKGIIFFAGTNSGLDTSVGAGGGGVAIEMGTGQSLRWLDNTNAVKAEMWGTSTGVAIPQGLNGVTNGVAATAGNIGEYQPANTTGTSLTTNTPANCASKSLTAGDWDVWGTVTLVPAGTTTVAALYGGISTTSATLPSLGNYADIVATFATGQIQTLSVPMQIVNVSSPTTVYVVGQASFGASTATCNGNLYARRRH